MLVVALTPLAARAEDFDTEHIFGFMIGADVGTVGEREFQSETTGRFSKDGRSYQALGQEVELEFVPITNFRVEVGRTLAAHNIVANRVLHFLARRTLDTIRSVDTLIWALIWINVVGLGPFAGALAIASTDLAAFGKLMSEAIETADKKPVEGIVSTGGGRILGIRFGILPEVFPVLASQVLYFFESNTRSATIIGIVGAGGIGLQLSEQIRTYDFDQVAFVIIMILITVAAIDWMCGKLRFYVIGQATAPTA